MSFALILPTSQDGFLGYLLQKGLNMRYKTPFIYKNIEGSAIKAGIATSEAAFFIV